MSEEVFLYPTVKEVAFQITFPHLFSIEMHACMRPTAEDLASLRAHDLL